ncbi:Na+/H+ antiporter subunit D, partial [Amycolatopsis sp. H6(2020)]|nr:Na+/H+ antiporter subunit D [Amycolatopsis sp. H6(2020)]
MTIFDLAPAAVILPLMTAGLDFVFYRRPNVQRVVSLAAVVAVLVLEIGLLAASWSSGPVSVSLGGWGAPLG